MLGALVIWSGLGHRTLIHSAVSSLFDLVSPAEEEPSFQFMQG
jgi:hypothetical protein